MARNFYVDNINDNHKLNEISLLLNGMEEVSRIKIGKTGISFYCENPDNVHEVLKNNYPDLVLKEEIINIISLFSITLLSFIPPRLIPTYAFCNRAISLELSPI